MDISRLTAGQLAGIDEEYFSRWDGDSLSDPIIGNSLEPQPLRHFRGFIAALCAPKRKKIGGYAFVTPDQPVALDLERTTFLQFLARMVRVNGESVSIESLAFHALYLPTVRNCVWETLAGWQGPVRVDLESLREALGDGRLQQDLSLRLWPETLRRYGDRPLISWFVRDRNSDGWYRYFERSFSSNDTRFPGTVSDNDSRRKLLRIEAGTVELRINRLHRESEEVNAYEWEARLLSDVGVLLSVANGSLFIRKRGVSWIDLDRLFYTADSCSDHDAAVVHELYRPGEVLDVSEPDGDLVILWNWERAPTAPPGSGSDCLIAALTSLKKSYKGLSDIVVDARPGQFASWSDGWEPKQVAVLRAAALDRMVELIQSTLAQAGQSLWETMVIPTLDEHPLGVQREIGRRCAHAVMTGEGHWAGIGERPSIHDIMGAGR